MPFNTFRQIGSRVGVQGGGSFQNLFVAKQMSLSHCMMVSTKPVQIDENHDANVLFESTKRALLNNETLIENIAVSVRNYLEKEYLDLSGVKIILEPLMNVNSLKQKVVESVNALFVSVATPVLVCNESFQNTLVQKLLPIGLVSQNILNDVSDIILNFLPYDIFLQKVSTIFESTLYANPLFSSSIVTLEKSFNAFRVSLGDGMLINKNTVTLLEFEVKNNYSYNILLQSTTFQSTVSTTIQRITITAVRADNLVLVQTFLNVAYSTALTATTVSFATDIFNTSGSSYNIYIRVYAELSNASSSIYANPIFLIKESIINPALPVPSLYTTIDVGKWSRPIEIYRVNNVLIFTINTNYTLGGMVLFSLRTPIYFIAIPLSIKSVNCTSGNYIYIASTVDGRVSLGGLNNIYNGGVPIVITQVKNNGTPIWFANISCLGLSNEDITGIVGDSKGNVYVYGSHTTGNSLYVYNSDQTLNTSALDTTPATNVSTGAVYGLNAFLVKINTEGFLISYATIIGENNQSISDVFVDTETDYIYITGTTESLSETTITGFNSEIIKVPANGRFFVLRSGEDVVNHLFIFEPTNITDTIFANKVAINRIGEMFVIYNLNTASINIYSANNFTTPSEQNVTGTYVLIKYNKYGEYVFKLPIMLDYVFKDNTCNVCTTYNMDYYINFLTVSPFQIQGLPVIPLPTNVVDMNVLVRFSGANNSIMFIALIVGSIVTKLYSYINTVFLQFAFENVVSIYRLEIAYAPSSSKLTFGSNGRSGTAVVSFNDELIPVLIGYTYNT